MRVLSRLAVTTLLVVSSLAAWATAPSVHATHADASGGAALESLSILGRSPNQTVGDPNNGCWNIGTGATFITPQQPATANGQSINRGLRLTALLQTNGTSFCSSGDSVNSYITFDLGGRYSLLAGTLYHDDRATLSTVYLSISIKDKNGIAHTLKTISVGTGGRVSFQVKIAGDQSLTLSAPVAVSSGNNTISSIADIVATVLYPIKTVASVYPLRNTILPAGTSIVFIWKPFSGAAAYSLLIWMVKQAGHTPISAATPLMFSKTILGKTTYTWNNAGFLPGTYKYDILPLDAYGNALGDTSAPIQIKVTR